METVTAKVTNRTKCLSMIISIHSLCCILNNFQVMSACNLHNFIHLTANTGIMDRNDCSGLLCDCIFDKIFIYIHRIRTNINEYNLCTSKYKSIRSGNKCIRWHDDLIPWLDITQECRHLQCMRTGCCQENLIYLETFFHPC